MSTPASLVPASMAPQKAAAAASTGNTASAAATNALTNLSSNFQDFLGMLMTQLQNQDPTSPMDTNQFTQELVEFSSVEQQINTNSSLTQLIQLTQSGQVEQSASIVGHQVELNSANIVVQNVPYKTVFLSRKYGLTTTSARVIGSGSALMLSETGTAGTAVKGTWSKPGIHDVTNYLDANNRPVGFQRGSTWVILAPPGTRVSTAGGRP